MTNKLKYKMLISDFDDTLLREDSTISRENIDAIKEFEKLGGIFAICTGRLLCSILPWAKKIGLVGKIISCQGAVIADIESGDVIYDNGINVSDALRIVKILEDRKEYFHVYFDNKIFVTDYNENTKEYERLCGVTVTKIDTTFVKFIGKEQKKLNKILVMSTPARVQEMIAEFTQSEPNMVCSMSKPYFFEIVDKECTKGKAIEFYSKSLGINQSEIVAVGDSYNDIPMIKFAGLGVAVGNAQEKVKQIADVITVTNDEHAIREVINRYIK